MKKSNRANLRTLLLAGVAGLAGCFAASSAHAAFPDHPVHFLVGFPAGGGADLLSRIVGQKLSEKWRQQVLVENKPGANGTIADDYVAHAPADGYTILMVTLNHVTTPAQMKVNYDPVKGFAGISRLATAPEYLAVNPNIGVNSAKELIALAKSKPNQLNVGDLGQGSVQWLLAELLMQRTNTKMTTITYKGSGPAIAALLGNEIQLDYATPPDIAQHAKEGKLKILGVSTKSRTKMLPDVPTIAEAAGLPGYEGGNWYGVGAPAGTPKDIVDKIGKDIAEALKAPDVQAAFTKQGFELAPDSPADFDKFIADETARWTPIMKSLAAAN